MDKEKLNKLLSDLNLTGKGKESGDKYVITVKDSNELSKLYTLLDKYEDADLDPEGMIMSDKSLVMVYLTDDFDITLKGDLDKDVYNMIIEDAK